MLTTAIEKHDIKNLLWCKNQIIIWEHLHFTPDCRHFAEIRIRCEQPSSVIARHEAIPCTISDSAEYFIELSIDCKTISQTQISQKAFEALSLGQPSARCGNIEFFSLNQFVPAGTEALNELEYE